MSFYTNAIKWGNQILYRGYDDEGNQESDKVRYKPTLYVPDKSGRKVLFRSFDTQEPLAPLPFPSIKEAKEYSEMYRGVDGHKVYGFTKWDIAYLADRFPGTSVPFVRDLIAIATIDIETQSDKGFPDADNPTHTIYSIAVSRKSGQGTEKCVFGLKPYDPEKIQERYTFEYRQFQDESAMLEAFLVWWEKLYPDVVTGWNTEYFDLPYLVARLRALLGDDVNRLSPWNNVSLDKDRQFGADVTIASILGVSQLDYMALFRKFTKNTYGEQESYSLDFIAELVLGEKKVDYSQYSSLEDLYENNHELFVQYNMHDVVLVDRLDEKLGLLSLVFALAYMAGVNYTDTLGTVGIWDAIIFRHLAKDGIIPPPQGSPDKADFAGGFVKDVQVGLHNWVLSFDLNSLYPNILVQWNMSPETLVTQATLPPISVSDFIENKRVDDPHGVDLTIAANGTRYRRDKQGVIPHLVEDLYARRVKIQAQLLELEKQKETGASVDKEIDRLNTLQTAIKILMNSLYGAMGNKYFRYYDVRIAEGVTLTGQLVSQWAEKHVNDYLNSIVSTEKDRVVAMDTDSLYLVVSDVVDKFKPKDPISFLDSFSKEGVNPVLKQCFAELCTLTKGYKNCMAMKREIIADRGIWRAAKNYILNVRDSKGVRYAEPKMKIVGIEAIKSTTPKICKGAMKKIFSIIMNKTEQDAQKFIAEFRESFDSAPPEEIAIPGNSNEFLTYADKTTIYKKGSPIMARAVLLHNHYVRKAGLENTSKLIRPGDKVKRVFLRTPNPVMGSENVIAFATAFPMGLNLLSYIDRDTQFEKTFLNPIESILTLIKWNSKEVSSLEDFFS